MEKQLGFGYTKAPFRYIAKYKNGEWQKGYLSEEENLVLNESACVFQYAQTCFEGLKARKCKDGAIRIFRPDMNAERMTTSAKRLCMPEYPKDLFLNAILSVIKANIDIIPSYESGGSLYIRPFMVGTNPVLGVKPASEFEFRIFVSPVGPYFQGGKNSVNLRVCDMDRAAPHGTGNVKLGLNYAMSLFAITQAHKQGYDENLYLDAATRTYIEETGGANIFFITKNGELVTPKSDSILPSITRISLIEIAEKEFGMKVYERRVRLDEIGNFVECGLCGTAAVITPVRSINDHGKVYEFFGASYTDDSICGRLRKALSDIQTGEKEAPDSWIYIVN